MDKYTVVCPASDGRQPDRSRRPRSLEEQPRPDEETSILGASEIWVREGQDVDPARFGGDWVYRVDGHRQKARPRTWPPGAASPGLKTIFGVVRSEQDFADRLYDDDQGRVEIEADVAGFVASAVAWEVIEYVLVDPPAARLSGKGSHQ